MHINICTLMFEYAECIITCTNIQNYMNVGIENMAIFVVLSYKIAASLHGGEKLWERKTREKNG